MRNKTISAILPVTRVHCSVNESQNETHAFMALFVCLLVIYGHGFERAYLTISVETRTIKEIDVSYDNNTASLLVYYTI